MAAPASTCRACRTWRTRTDREATARRSGRRCCHTARADPSNVGGNVCQQCCDGRTQPDARDLSKITDLRDEAHAALTILDNHLSRHAYVCGDAFTMGDIPLGCVAYRYFNVDVERPPLPNVEAWYKRLTERTAYQDHVMRHFGTNPDEWAALEKACATEGVI